MAGPKQACQSRTKLTPAAVGEVTTTYTDGVGLPENVNHVTVPDPELF